MSAVADQKKTRLPLVQASIVLSICVVAVPAVWYSSGGVWTVENPTLTATIAVTFFVIRLLALHLPQGDDVRATLMVGLFGLGVLHVPSVLAAALIAGLLDVAVEHSRSSARAWTDAVLDALRSTAVIAIVSPAAILFQDQVAGAGATDAVLVPILVTGALYMGLDLASISVLHSVKTNRSPLHSFSQLARPLIFIYTVHIAMAAVVLRTYPQLGIWGFAIGLLLTLILQNSFNLYLRIRRAYSETIGALARAAELDRPTDAGHAQRVAELSVAVGRRMGMSGSELERLNYAAQLHDIGRIGSEDLDDEVLHANRGAEIVGAIPFLASTGPCIERHHELDDPDLPLCAAIVGVCSAFDRMRGLGSPDDRVRDLRTQARGTSLEVIEALSFVVRRQRSLGTTS
jgi:hypothetical protein